MKKIIVSLLSIALLASVVLTGCAKSPVASTPNPSPQSPASQSTPAPSPASPVPVPAPEKPPLEVTANIAKTGYSLGEEVKINFTFKNVSSSAVQLQPFSPLVEIYLPIEEQIVRSFTAGAGTKSLSPGEAANYTVTWDQRDSQQKPVGYGYYFVQTGNIQVAGYNMKPAFGMTAPILILPADGAMEKTIEVNQTQKVGEISITLERVELSASGMKIYVFNTPAGYSLHQGSQLPPPPMMISASGEYTIDGSAVKKTGPSAIRFLDKGMEHIWENLNPVPKTAKELTFRITRFGPGIVNDNLTDKEGPWEFRVSLQ